MDILKKILSSYGKTIQIYFLKIKQSQDCEISLKFGKKKIRFGPC